MKKESKVKHKLKILSVAFLALSAPMTAGVPESTKPALPAVEELRIEPAGLTLEHGRDARRVLVSGRTAEGVWIDLTSIASFEEDSEAVEIDDHGFFHAKATGEAPVKVFAAGLQTNFTVTAKSGAVPPVRFVRDVMPILAKAGCNAGTCHGAQQGKNGFRLSLRGYDPDWDYHSLVEDISGRRFNRAAPEMSLMLQKPTGEVPHEGKQVIAKDSEYYNLLKSWIGEGVKNEPMTERVASLELLPADPQIPMPGMTQQFLVIAHYPDGTTRDVTRDADFTSNMTDVATVTKEGLVTAIRRGEAALLVRYEGQYATKPMAVMGDRTGFAWQEQEEINYIDKHVNAKLQRLKILPSELCTDSEFIRRVSLDLTGLPPTPEKTRAFLDDPSPSKDKRERLVDELIGSRDYVEHWTNKWADLLQCNSKYLGEKGVLVFRKWIEDSIDRNKPYDEFVKTLITAEGSSYKNPPANYFRVLRETPLATENVSQLFLGVRFSCAKCHDHPFEKWTQNQYYEFGAFFSRVKLKNGTLPGEEIVYTDRDAEEYKHLRTNMDVAPSVPFGKMVKVEADGKRRAEFAEWLASKENPLFAQALVNRVWSYFMGRGIIEPVDDIRTSNPPSNPELLNALAEDFVANNFDMKFLMRRICLSNTYQRSIQENEWNKDDTANFARAVPRRLSAEQMLDAIAVATDVKLELKGLAPNSRAAMIPDGMVEGNTFLTLFGKPKRESSCECERTSNVSLAHALNLINGPTVGEAITSPASRIAKLVESSAEDQRIIEEIYLAVLCRPPSEGELAAIDLTSAPTKLEGAQDLAWALLNSPAFLFNH
jgi:hypothetical protein